MIGSLGAKPSGFTERIILFKSCTKVCCVKPAGRFPIYNLRSVLDAVGKRAKDCTKLGLGGWGKRGVVAFWFEGVAVNTGNVSGKITWGGGWI